VVSAALCLALLCHCLTGSVVPLVTPSGSDATIVAHSRHILVAEVERDWVGESEAIAAFGDHGGARVVTGKSPARIPAPERHDRLTVAATKEREASCRSDHGGTRARHPVAR